jgi:hypothetical protein
MIAYVPIGDGYVFDDLRFETSCSRTACPGTGSWMIAAALPTNERFMRRDAISAPKRPEVVE